MCQRSGDGKETVSGRRPVDTCAVNDVVDFRQTVLVVSAGLVLAIGGRRVLAGKLRVPSAALLLVAAAIASDVVDRLADVPLTASCASTTLSERSAS